MGLRLLRASGWGGYSRSRYGSCRVNRLRVPRCGGGSADCRTARTGTSALDHLPRNADGELARVEAPVHSRTTQVLRHAAEALCGCVVALGVPVRGPLPDVPAMSWSPKPFGG